MRRFILLLILLIITLLPGFGQTIESMVFSSGLFWLGNSEQNSAPSPILVFPAFGLNIRITPEVVFSPELKVTYIEYIQVNGRFVPGEIEAANAVKTLAFLFDLPVTYNWKISDQISLAAGGGIGLFLRIPFGTFDGADNLFGAAFADYYAGIKFLYPMTTESVSYTFTKNWGAAIALKQYYPFFDIINGQPFFDQFILSGEVGIQYRF